MSLWPICAAKAKADPAEAASFLSHIRFAPSCFGAGTERVDLRQSFRRALDGRGGRTNAQPRVSSFHALEGARA
jgi:hypothetical protein